MCTWFAIRAGGRVVVAVSLFVVLREFKSMSREKKSLLQKLKEKPTSEFTESENS